MKRLWLAALLMLAGVAEAGPGECQVRCGNEYQKCVVDCTKYFGDENKQCRKDCERDQDKCRGRCGG